MVLWILALEPVPRPAKEIWRANALRHDAFEAELGRAVAPSVLMTLAIGFNVQKAGSRV
jgi:hypothetical protein